MMLAGKRGLVIGVANGDSIATGCARAFRAAGARLALTYLNERAQPHVAEVAAAVEAELLLPLDVEDDAQLDGVFGEVARCWGGLDFLLHSIAFCPKEALQSRSVDVSREDFARAMDVSCHSFIRIAKRCELLMPKGGSLMTVSYYGAEKVVDNYNIMGPVKAALEACVAYLAADLGPQRIRVNGLSPGPIRTRAASGIRHFDALINAAAARAPQHALVTPDDVGAYAVFLASDGAHRITGNINFIDAGDHVMS